MRKGITKPQSIMLPKTKDLLRMRSADAKVQAIVVSDLHFSTSPLSRAEKGEAWKKVTAFYWNQVQQASKIYGQVPIIVAGDVFNLWNSSAEVINMAMQIMTHPNIYAIPGQHDLPLHQIKDIGKSAYWTLVCAGRIKNLVEGDVIRIGNLRVHSFPFGTKIIPPNRQVSDHVNVAICHQYIWSDNRNSFTDAPRECFIGNIAEQIKGYQVACFGDNHQAFTFRLGTYKSGKEFTGTEVMNCGGFMCRNSDQKDYRPRIGFIYSDGTIGIEYLQKEDKWLRRDEIDIPDNPDLEQLMSLLEEETSTVFDYRETMEKFFIRYKTEPVLKRMITYWMENSQGRVK